MHLCQTAESAHSILASPLHRVIFKIVDVVFLDLNMWVRDISRCTL